MNTEEESELRGSLNFTIIVFQTMGGGEEHVASNLQEKVMLRKFTRFSTNQCCSTTGFGNVSFP